METFYPAILLCSYGEILTPKSILPALVLTFIVFTDENALVQKNTSVIVRRVPGLKQGGILSHQEMAGKNERYAEKHLSKASESNTQPEQANPDVLKTIEGSDEAERIASLVQNSAMAFDQFPVQARGRHNNRGGFRGGRNGGSRHAHGSGGNFSAGQGGGNSYPERAPRPSSNYVCHRCNKPGHWIDQCPTNGDPTYDKIKVRAPTGIPRSMLRQVDAPESGTGLQDSSGHFVTLQPNEEEFARQTVGLRLSHAAAAAGVGKEGMEDPVMDGNRAQDESGGLHGGGFGGEAELNIDSGKSGAIDSLHESQGESGSGGSQNPLEEQKDATEEPLHTQKKTEDTRVVQRTQNRKDDARSAGKGFPHVDIGRTQPYMTKQGGNSRMPPSQHLPPRAGIHGRTLPGMPPGFPPLGMPPFPPGMPPPPPEFIMAMAMANGRPGLPPLPPGVLQNMPLPFPAIDSNQAPGLGIGEKIISGNPASTSQHGDLEVADKEMQISDSRNDPGFEAQHSDSGRAEDVPFSSNLKKSEGNIRMGGREGKQMENAVRGSVDRFQRKNVDSASMSKSQSPKSCENAPDRIAKDDHMSYPRVRQSDSDQQHDAKNVREALPMSSTLAPSPHSRPSSSASPRRRLSQSPIRETRFRRDHHAVNYEDGIPTRDFGSSRRAYGTDGLDRGSVRGGRMRTFRSNSSGYDRVERLSRRRSPSPVRRPRNLSYSGSPERRIRRSRSPPSRHRYDSPRDRYRGGNSRARRERSPRRMYHNDAWDERPSRRSPTRGSRYDRETRYRERRSIPIRSSGSRSPSRAYGHARPKEYRTAESRDSPRDDRHTIYGAPKKSLDPPERGDFKFGPAQESHLNSGSTSPPEDKKEHERDSLKAKSPQSSSRENNSLKRSSDRLPDERRDVKRVKSERSREARGSSRDGRENTNFRRSSSVQLDDGRDTKRPRQEKFSESRPLSQRERRDRLSVHDRLGRPLGNFKKKRGKSILNRLGDKRYMQ